MDPTLRQAVEAALGSSIQKLTPLLGGDINQAHQLRLKDGRTAFIKSNPKAPLDLFPAEARGLAWLAESAAISTPEVLACSPAGAPPTEAFLALQLIPAGRPARDFDPTLGRQLAALHQVPQKSFGLKSNNFIGTLPQSNQPHPTWCDFYREERLAPLLTRACNQGFFDSPARRRWETLLTNLESYAGPPEAPARLHGDLWGGNLLVNQEGRPCLIDPAVYGGHREMDLAMMKLFGGFGPAVFEAYHEAFPLAPGHQERVPLYQLYPLLVHVNLFGGHYVADVLRALNHYR